MVICSLLSGMLASVGLIVYVHAFTLDCLALKLVCSCAVATVSSCFASCRLKSSASARFRNAATASVVGAVDSPSPFGGKVARYASHSASVRVTVMIKVSLLCHRDNGLGLIPIPVQLNRD